MEIVRATADDLEELIPLFNGYRIFYEQASDLGGAHNFLKERLDGDESVIFLAVDENGQGLGFTQLYPSFSSVSMQRVYILNDLFVDASARGRQVGTGLLDRAKEFAFSQGAKGLVLETAADNPAQKLYEKNGWTKDTALHYYWQV